MKRKLIKRNKQFLSGLLIQARLNNLPLPMVIDLLNQKSELNMASRKKLAEDWSLTEFGDGFFTYHKLPTQGGLFVIGYFLDKADLPQSP